MKTIHAYISILCFLLLSSCNDQEVISTPSALQPGEYRFTVTIPELVTATRTMGDAPTNVENMPMRVLVFDENGFFVAFQEAKINSFTPDDKGGGTGTYTVSLPISNERCILHFVLGLEDADYGKIFTPTDSEASIFNQLTVSGGKDAYWQRLDIENGIDENTELPKVTLIRNFAKISVVSEANNFTLQGYTIVNKPVAGTVAPYSGSDANGGFAIFDLSNASGDNVYKQFTSVNPDFNGNNAGIDETDPIESDFTNDAKYIYERNQTSQPAYILLRGEYNGISYYYKLDIVSTDKTTWITSYLNLYRNFHYQITINNVTGIGYNTISDAMNAAASNNIGASVDVSEVNTIQDGLNELYVSVLDTLLVTTDEVEIQYTYRTGINQGEGNLHNEQVVITPVNVNTDILTYNTSKLGVLKVTPTGLPALMEEQEFVIAAKESGLSRRVIVRVRQPFRFEVVDCDDFVPEEIGELQTLRVRLPENMPYSAFPLILDIEPERKTLYPDVTNNRIPVHSEGNHTFSYQASITYEDYLENYTGFYVFKTNMAESATSIKVTNPFFVDETKDPAIQEPYNVTDFRNQARYDFFDVTLSSAGNGSFDATPNNTNKGTFTFNEYNPNGKTITLSFKMHREGEEYDTPHPEVEIYAYHLDLEDAQTNTGKFTVREDGECILYVPDNPLAEQIITFETTTDYARETMQLSSYDHATATVDYKNQDCTISVEYGNNRRTEPLNRESVEIYDNANYRGEPIRTFETDRNGQCTINTYIIELNPTQTYYFRYEERESFGSSTYYDAAMTIEELLSEQELILRE